MKLKRQQRAANLPFGFEADDQISLIDNKSQTTAGMSCFLFFKNFRIFAKFSRNFGKKFEILQQRQNETFFLLRLGNFRVLVEKFFSVLYHRLIDLEILQESRFISSSE